MDEIQQSEEEKFNKLKSSSFKKIKTLNDPVGDMSDINKINGLFINLKNEEVHQQKGLQ